VEVGGHHSNRQHRVERLVVAWNQGPAELPDDDVEGTDPRIAVSVEPTGRTRTPLTPSEVAAIRTLHAAGARATDLARQFCIHAQQSGARPGFDSQASAQLVASPMILLCQVVACSNAAITASPSCSGES
jgi:hypothetical protein